MKLQENFLLRVDVTGSRFVTPLGELEIDIRSAYAAMALFIVVSHNRVPNFWTILGAKWFDDDS